ncbi:MAG: response regulator [Proteobacteria bacterium]|nr:response regulator [Pseudomonadota bacterium]
MQQTQKVLIVDDSDFQADMLESILVDLGISNVTKAINGSDALKHFEKALLSETAYSLVFLDIVMPEMDGQEALKRMRALEKEAGIGGEGKTTIIMVTSLSSPADMITALIEGDCTDYVVKPVAESILKALLVKYGLIT